MNTLIVIFLLSVTSSLALARPACDNMKISLVPTNYNTNTTATVAFTVRVDAITNDGGCDYFIAIGYGSSSSYNTRSVKFGSYSWPYQIAKDAGGTQIIKYAPDFSSCSDVLCDSFPTASGNNTKNSTYQFILDSSNQWRKSGSYSDNYTLRLYKGTPSSYTLEDQATMNVTFTAPKKTDIALVDSGASFNVADTTQTMNFGNMSAGTQRTSDLIVKYNAGCTLLASSQNNGSMKHTTQNQLIAYTMVINGFTINLAGTSGSPRSILSGSGVSPADGDVNPIVVTVGSVAGKSPGTYTDTITFTVQSNE